jgi:hypothetical protein
MQAVAVVEEILGAAAQAGQAVVVLGLMEPQQGQVRLIQVQVVVVLPAVLLALVVQELL